MRLLRNRYLQYVIGLIIFMALYFCAFHNYFGGWIGQYHAVPAGIAGDQAFYMWALERARNAVSYGTYIHNCDWNIQGCFIMTAIPQEWPNLYFVGKMGKVFNLHTNDIINIWYMCSLVFNGLAAAYFLSQYIRSPVIFMGLAPFVAFQLSILWRMMGHFSLIAVWPMYMFFSFLIIILRLAAEGKLKTSFMSVIVLPVTIFILTQVSFYYFMFAILIMIVILGVYCLLHIAMIKRKTILSMLWISIPSLFALCIGLYVVSYTFLPDTNLIDQSFFVRSIREVEYYSAHWSDFIIPRQYTVLDGYGLAIGFDSLHNRGEVFGYLGFVVILISVIAALSLLYYVLIFGMKSFIQLLPWRDILFLLLIAVVSLFFATGTGGLIIHKVLPSFRCFNRLTPVAVLFLTAFAGMSLMHTLRSNIVVAAYSIFVGLVGYFEISGQPLLAANRIVSTYDTDKSIAILREVCMTHEIALMPEVTNYIDGPYWIYYWAEAARCRMTNVWGAGFVQHDKAQFARLPVATIRWRDYFVDPRAEITKSLSQYISR